MRTKEEFLLLVEQMRIAQKNYFTTPKEDALKQHWLYRSKELESQVDQEIKDFHSPKLF